MNFGLNKVTIDKINNVLQKYSQVDKVIIYGSRAKGNFKTGSDIDLVSYGEDLDLTTLNKIENDLDDLFLPYSIDISLFKYIDNEKLLEHIKRLGKIFYKKPV